MKNYRAVIVVGALTLLAACRGDDKGLASTSRRVFGTIPAATVSSPQLVELGKKLYFSNELSLNRTQSCNSCHPVEGHSPGVDRLAVSKGALGKDGRRNTPTTLNAAFHFVQFWDGRAATLEDQAAGPIVNPVEMAMPDAQAVAERLRTSPHIDRALFRAAFPKDPDPYTLANAARAIAAFERTLVTRDRFDEFQSGRYSALTSQEKEGLRLFMSYGCTSCHNGPLVGAKQYQKLGVVKPYETADRGRAEVTSKSGDEYVFKVPSLRNVAMTGPYFHDGKVPTLDAAVEKMAWHQLGTKIPQKDRDAIVAFLRALSDVERGPKAKS